MKLDDFEEDHWAFVISLKYLKKAIIYEKE